jgi:hypothetical protein
VSWILCTISEQSRGNWALCKQVGLWGVSTYGEKPRFGRVDEGDHLLFWIAANGYIGHALVTGPMRAARGAEETPWPGGIRRHARVVPMKIEFELAKPLMLRFPDRRQVLTGLSAYQFRRGFIKISDDAAEAAVEAMHAAAPDEALLSYRSSPAPGASQPGRNHSISLTFAARATKG